MADFPKQLPPECTNDVWSLLQPSDLLSVMRISSVWRRSAEPILYRRIDIRSLAGMAAFLRTAKERPDLASSVRYLCVHNVLTEDSNHVQFEGTFISILERLPGLRRLHIYRWPSNVPVLAAAIQRTPGVAGLRGLKEIILEESDRPMDDLRPLWNLPVLESIQASVSEPQSMSGPWLISSTVTKLNLDSTIAEEGTIGLLLQALPGLKRFRDLMVSLQYVQNTLEGLELRASLYSPYAEEVEYYNICAVEGHIGSLENFSSLRKLKAPIAMLLGWLPDQAPCLSRILPRSLTYLSLTEDLSSQCSYSWSEKLVLMKVECFLAAARQATPLLEKLELLPNREFGRWDALFEDQLHALCLQAGVACIILDNEGSDDRN
ncbi:hypothetical protein EYZ11_007318 [Aspergillus tanneri]|uniref:F-box domain-containing protein n=1 Tax=Aspergillus tanneri TaxID=1220188 RepID=A0A4S3JD98_9EURO|nr:hypothetical protein EYZ11_007318 [Aspergillus tanneri]